MSAQIRFDAGDAAELIDMFEWFCDWFDHDRNVLDRSFTGFTGGMSLGELRDDLRRLGDRLSTAPIIRDSQ